MRYRMLALALFLGLGASAACYTDITVVEYSPHPRGYRVQTVRLKGERQSTIALFYDWRPIDSTDLNLGQMALGFAGYPNERSLILYEGTRANLVLADQWGLGLFSGDANPTFGFNSGSWRAQDPTGHPGVVYSSLSTFIYMEFDQEYINEEFGSFFPLQNYASAKIVDRSFPTTNLPIQPERVQYVLPRQVRDPGCAGEDSLTIRSEGGVQSKVSDRYKRQAAPFLQVQELTIHCSRLFTNLQDALNYRDSLEKTQQPVRNRLPVEAPLDEKPRCRVILRPVAAIDCSNVP